jgi:hypothetical protein
MKRLAFVLAAAALLLPGAAHAAACSPLNCAPSQFTLAGGSLVAYRHTALGTVRVADLRTGNTLFSVPGGFVGGNLLVHKAGRQLLQWYDLRTGALHETARVPWPMSLSGVSQDGSRAVGFRRLEGATYVILGSRRGWRQVPLPSGNWDFDALHGNNLFLIKYLRNGSYQVKVLDLSTDSPTVRLLKDPHESGTIWGQPFSRLGSSDGRMLFTLYVAGNGAAMIHALDLVHATARCIDLPGTGDYGSASSWALVLSPDESTLWAVSPGYGRVVALDVATRSITTAFSIARPATWNLGNGTRIAMSRDGNEIALGDGKSVVTLALATRKLGPLVAQPATALGYAPTGELRALR